MQKFLLVFEKYFYWWIILLLVFIPLYPKFPLFNVPLTYVAIRAEDLLIGLTLVIWIFGNIGKLKKYFSQTIYQAILLFWLIGFISLFSAILVTYFVEPHLGLLHWFRRIEYMSLFIVASTSFYSIKQIKYAVFALFISALVVILYGFGQIWLDFPVVSTTNKEFSKGLILYLTNGARVNSTFAGHYDLAAYLSIIIVLAVSLFFYYKKLFHKLLITLTGVLSFILLGFTAARISFVASILGIAAILWFNKQRLLLLALVFVVIGLLGILPDLRHRMVATITVNLLGGGGPKYSPPPGTVTKFTPAKSIDHQNGQLVYSSATESGAIAYDTVPGEPINTTELGVYRSFGIRTNVEWPRALNAFYKNPFLGTGYSSLTIATDNDFLRSLGETGILGTLSLALIFFIILKRMLIFIRDKSGFVKFFITGLICSTIVMLVTATFIDVFESSKVAEIFWVLLGIGWAAMKIEKQDEENLKQ